MLCNWQVQFDRCVAFHLALGQISRLIASCALLLGAWHKAAPHVNTLPLALSQDILHTCKLEACLAQCVQGTEKVLVTRVLHCYLLLICVALSTSVSFAARLMVSVDYCLQMLKMTSPTSQLLPRLSSQGVSCGHPWVMTPPSSLLLGCGTMTS